MLAMTVLESFDYTLKLHYDDAVPFIISIANNKLINEIEKWIKSHSKKI
jgi:ABC-type proline/glycine betaine transport system substrate-binding protein